LRGRSILAIEMRKLAQVEEAKAIMREGMEWSVVRWLKEKRKVRKMADRANAALDALDREVKEAWPAELREAYEADAELELALRIRRADDAAARARAKAEKTFDEAEAQLSARLAREGCLQAIQSWELREQAIRLSERGALFCR
jgi:RecG-like helicase